MLTIRIPSLITVKGCQPKSAAGARGVGSEWKKGRGGAGARAHTCALTSKIFPAAAVARAGAGGVPSLAGGVCLAPPAGEGRGAGGAAGVVRAGRGG